MPESKFHTERTYECWDDAEGVCIRVGPDDDTGCLVQVKTNDATSIDFFGEHRLVISPEMARQLGQAILNCAADLLAEEAESSKQDRG